MKLMRYLPRFRAAYRALPALEAREGWTRAELEAFQCERLNAVWRHAVKHVPHYHRMQRERGLPSTFATLEEFQSTVPPLPCAEVRSDPRRFVSERPQPGAWELTGGSTGLPAKFYWGHRAKQEMLRAKYRFLAMWGADIFDRDVFLWGHGASFAPGLPGLVARLRRPVEDRLRNRLRLSAYRMGPNDLRGYLRRIAAFQPVGIYAYTTAAYLLAREAKAAGFHCDSLRFVILTAEPALPHLVDAVERGFGVPAIVEYGSTDCGLLANEWPDRTLRVREDRVILETVPRDDGRFDIVVTVLDNPSFPLVRYMTNDVTDAPLVRFGRGFAVLANVAGRSNDLVLSRAGLHVHPTLLYEILEYKAIRCYRVHQHADGSVSVLVQPSDPASLPDTNRLKREIEAAVDGYPVTLEIVDAIATSPAGKHRWITSDRAPSTAAPCEIAARAPA